MYIRLKVKIFLNVPSSPFLNSPSKSFKNKRTRRNSSVIKVVAFLSIKHRSLEEVSSDKRSLPRVEEVVVGNKRVGNFFRGSKERSLETRYF